MRARGGRGRGRGEGEGEGEGEEDLLELLHVGGRDALAEELDPTRVVTSSSARLPLIKICRREGGARLPLSYPLAGPAAHGPGWDQGRRRGGDSGGSGGESARARVV